MYLSFTFPHVPVPGNNSLLKMKKRNLVNIFKYIKGITQNYPGSSKEIEKASEN